MSDEHRIDDALRAWAEERSVHTPTPADARALVTSAEGRRQGRRVQVGIVVAMAAAVLLVLSLALGIGARVWLADPEPLMVELVRADGSGQLQGASLAVAEEGRVIAQVGPDRVAVDRRSVVDIAAAEVGRTELVLERGRLAAEVARRDVGEAFTVHAADVRVTVIGTRFSVSRTPETTVVAVDEGTVQVDRGEDRWRIRAGHQLVLPTNGEAVVGALAVASPSELFAELEPEPTTDAAPEPEAAAPPAPTQTPMTPPPGPRRDPVAEARAQLLAGDPGTAETLLLEHLDTQSKDADAWSLLATARRKGGDRDGSLEAWRQVITHGGAPEVARARFEAASLLQAADRHEAAIVELQALLATPSRGGSLEPEVRLRLGRSLLATGREGEAHTQLAHLREHFPGTAAADAAATLLAD